MLDKEHDRLFNVSWWAGALIQRHALDLLAHEEGREHQKVGEAHPDNPIGPSYVLSDWDKAWIRDRVTDVLRDRLLARQEHAPVLDESLEAHEARELELRARDYFGGSHETTRAKFLAHREHHAKLHDNAHLIKHRPDPDSSLVLISAEAAAEIRAQHAQTIAQIDDYLAPAKGLIDRHIATVKLEVGEKRRVAQQHIDDCSKVLKVAFEEVVAEYTDRVLAEIRAHVPEAE